jgi:SAM-dependent methyltransferase
MPEEIEHTREFFAPRAAGWDDHFPDDEPVYREAIRDLDPPAGAVMLDLGCGTARAMPVMRHVIGDAATIVGIDVTPEMLAAARERGRERAGTLVLGDACAIPLRSDSVDVVFAAGLLGHVSDRIALLREIGRVARPDGMLALFHPIGRAALASRHGHALSSDDAMAPDNLRALLATSGWSLERVDDAETRYLAVARVAIGS